MLSSNTFLEFENTLINNICSHVFTKLTDAVSVPGLPSPLVFEPITGLLWIRHYRPCYQATRLAAAVVGEHPTFLRVSVAPLRAFVLTH